MKIETKFDIGQDVYCFDLLKTMVFRCTVCAIEIDDRRQLKYTLHNGDVRIEEELFSTPEECIQDKIDYYHRMWKEEISKKNEKESNL